MCYLHTHTVVAKGTAFLPPKLEMQPYLPEFVTQVRTLEEYLGSLANSSGSGGLDKCTDAQYLSSCYTV